MKIFETRDSRNRRVIYQYKEDGLFVLPLEDFNHHDILVRDECSFVFKFPLEIYSEIIKEVFCTRLATRNLDLLMELATINQFTAKLVYDQLYGCEGETPAQITIVEMLKRINQTLEILANLHDDYVIAERHTKRKVGIRLHHASHLENNPLISHEQFFDNPQNWLTTTTINPWNFCSNFEVLQIERAHTVNEISAIHGEYFGETLYVHGRNRNGMYQCSTYEHPVFVFLLVEQEHLLIPIKETFELTNTFGCFNDMLKIMYGPQTGVYFMIKNDINDITSHNDRFVQLIN